MKSPSNKNLCDRELSPVEDFASSPLLKSINWTSRMMIAFIRGGLMEGYYDSSSKTWLTSKMAVREALADRNRRMSGRNIDPGEL